MNLLRRAAQWAAMACVVVMAQGCGDRCAGVTCSGHGQCVVANGAPRCACDPGFTVSGLSCLAPTTPSCQGTGNTCNANGDCCGFSSGESRCVSGRCADTCTANSQCNSGCCASLVSGARACAAASNCSASCRAVNSTCSVNGDCCNFLAGTGYCVDGSCADSCTLNSQCASGCCAALIGGGKVCSARSFCP